MMEITITMTEITMTPTRRIVARLPYALVALSLLACMPATRPAASAAQPVARVAQQDSALARLAWLAGCWEGTLSNGALYEEMWLPPRAGAMLGTARMTRDGRVLSWEFMRIVEEDGVPIFMAQPSGRPATSFTARDVGDRSVIFENAGHDFPQRVSYRLDDGQLRARIEGERDGRVSGFDFPLARIRCAGG